MSKEVQPKKPRSTKKVSELEAKIAELEAKLSNLSSQVQPSTRPAQTSAPPPAQKAESKPAPRPAASGPTHGTLPAGMKPAPKPEPKPEPTSTSTPYAGDVAPAYAKISSTGYTGNKYFATRKRLSYHPADKQFTGSSTTTTTAPPPASTYSEPESHTSHETLPAGTKPQEKKSMWKAKGAEVAETYVGDEHAAPPPAQKAESKPAPRPAASGPTHGTLPAGMKPAPKPEPKPEPTSTSTPYAGDVAPAYAKISSTGYTGNKYFATRKRLSYHPADKQFTGSSTTTTTAPPAAEPPKPKSTIRGTLPAGFKS